MENQAQSTLMLKIEDDCCEVKQEPMDDTDTEYVQVDDPFSIEESLSEHGIMDTDESMGSLVTVSEDELALCNSSYSISRQERFQRRRLRFSEADDMVLLGRVAALNPYRCSALWKEVTHVVATSAGKDFSMRTIREHTDLLMNTFALRGADACLKRTPPDLWEKKKRLLEAAHLCWRKDPFPSSSKETVRVATSNKPEATNKPEAAKSVSGDPQLRLQDSAKPNATPSGFSTRPLSSSPAKSSPISLVIPRPSVPVMLHFGSPNQSLVYPAILSGLKQSPVTSQLTVQNVSSTSKACLSSLSAETPVQQKSLSAQSPRPDVVANCTLSDGPSNGMPEPCETSVPDIVDFSTSLSKPVDDTPEEGASNASCISTARFENPSSTASLDSGMVVEPSTDLRTSEMSSNSGGSITSGSSIKNQKWKMSSGHRASLNFLRKRHRDQFVLKHRELQLEKRRLALQEKKLALEERKVQLEEEKWLFDKKEREEKLMLMSEEREHKMAMERRQQDMIDILLELKKKD